MTGNGYDSHARCNTHADAQVNLSGISLSLSLTKRFPAFFHSFTRYSACINEKRNPVYFLPNQLETNTKFDMKKYPSREKGRIVKREWRRDGEVEDKMRYSEFLSPELGQEAEQTGIAEKICVSCIPESK